MKLLWGSPVSAGARVSVARPEGPQVAHHPPPTTGSSSPPVPPLTFEHLEVPWKRGVGSTGWWGCEAWGAPYILQRRPLE